MPALAGMTPGRPVSSVRREEQRQCKLQFGSRGWIIRGLAMRRQKALDGIKKARYAKKAIGFLTYAKFRAETEQELRF
jgi:hypothetical protein